MIRNSSRSILYKYARACMYVFSQQLKYETVESFLHMITTLKRDKSLSPTSPSFVLSLFDLLISTKRAHLFFCVLDIIFLLWCQEQNIQVVYAYSASPLDSNAQTKIESYFAKGAKKSKIHIIYIIDKKLIAGVRIESETIVWDYSLKTELDNIKKLIAGKGIS